MPDQSNAEHRQEWDARAWRLAVAEEMALTPAQRLVALYLQDRFSTWKTGGDVRPSMETLGEALGISRQGAQKHVAALTDGGWLTRTRAATNHAPAEYRLSYPWTQPAVASDDPDATSGCVQTQPAVASRRNQRLHNHSIDHSIDHSKNSLSHLGDAREADEPARHDERERAFDRFIQAYPHRQSRFGGGKTNAREAYNAVIDAGITHAEIMEDLSDEYPGIKKALVFADQWLDDLLTYTPKDPAARALIRERYRVDCPDCHDSGWQEDERGYPTSRCAHARAADVV